MFFSYIQQQKVSKCPQWKHIVLVLDSKLHLDIHIHIAIELLYV